MEAYAIIARNSVLIVIGITVFAAIGVAVATWFAKNTHERH